jgi:hypothetical protein
MMLLVCKSTIRNQGANWISRALNAAETSTVAIPANHIQLMQGNFVLNNNKKSRASKPKEEKRGNRY